MVNKTNQHPRQQKTIARTETKYHHNSPPDNQQTVKTVMTTKKRKNKGRKYPTTRYTIPTP
jgi:hypothetical protein